MKNIPRYFGVRFTGHIRSIVRSAKRLIELHEPDASYSEPDVNYNDNIPISPLPDSMESLMESSQSSFDNFTAAYGAFSSSPNNIPSINYNLLPFIKIVYYSRLNSRPVRHLHSEEYLISYLRNRLGLDKETSQQIRVNLYQTLSFSDNSDSEVYKPITYYTSKPFNTHNTLQEDLPKPIAFGSDSAMISLTILYGNETAKQTIETLSSASILIGPHGASLTNMIFLPIGAEVIEISNDGYW